MSILIKGMDMPTSCYDCYLKMNCDDCEGWECVCVPLRQQIGYLCDLPTDKRRDDCPLIPVPPHGRLGDLDELHKEAVRRSEKTGTYDSWYNCTDCVISAFDIANSPTVIPAESEGE